MDILGSMMGGLIDKEKITHDTIQSTLEDIAEELECKHTDFFVMIKPINEDFDMKFFIYKLEASKAPALVREISLKEILGIQKGK